MVKGTTYCKSALQGSREMEMGEERRRARTVLSSRPYSMNGMPGQVPVVPARHGDGRGYPIQCHNLESQEQREPLLSSLHSKEQRIIL